MFNFSLLLCIFTKAYEFPTCNCMQSLHLHEICVSSLYYSTNLCYKASSSFQKIAYAFILYFCTKIRDIFHRAISRSTRVNPDGPYIWCLAGNTNFGGQNLVTGTARGERAPLFEIPISPSRTNRSLSASCAPLGHTVAPPPPLPLSVANRPLRHAGAPSLAAFFRRSLPSAPAALHRTSLQLSASDLRSTPDPVSYLFL